MLIGAFAGAAGSYAAGSAMAGVLLSVVLGGMIGWFYALFCLKWKAHQSVVGVGINLFASGITAVMLKAIWQTEGMSESVPSISNLTIPGLSGIPVIGALFKDQSPYLYAMFLIVAAVWIVFYKTKFGLRYRAIGDQPYAVQTAGVQVNRYRYIAMIAAGSIAGLARFLPVHFPEQPVCGGYDGRAGLLWDWPPTFSADGSPWAPWEPECICGGPGSQILSDGCVCPVPVCPDAALWGDAAGTLFVGKRVKGPEALGKLVGLVLY